MPTMKMVSALNVVSIQLADSWRYLQLEQILHHTAMPGFRPGLDRLWDQRDCRIELSTAEIRWLADAWRAADAAHGRRRVAYLVENPVSWGLNRMFEALRGSSAASFGLFRSFPEARDWLGLPADFADPFEAARPAESEEEARPGGRRRRSCACHPAARGS